MWRMMRLWWLQVSWVGSGKWSDPYLGGANRKASSWLQPGLQPWRLDCLHGLILSQIWASKFKWQLMNQALEWKCGISHCGRSPHMMMKLWWLKVFRAGSGIGTTRILAGRPGRHLHGSNRGMQPWWLHCLCWFYHRSEPQNWGVYLALFPFKNGRRPLLLDFLCILKDP